MPNFTSFINFVAICACLQSACTGKEPPAVDLKNFAVTKDTAAISKDGLSFDNRVSSDGNGSFRLHSGGGHTVFELFEIDTVNVDDVRLIYGAKVKAENVQGTSYLEMWCGFEGKGEFFSRSLDSPIAGTLDWTSVETPFFLKRGERVSTVKLNFVMEGKGTVWVDDVRLMKAPLK
jgi:hypothetical protein